MKQLLDSFEYKGLSLKNRIVMPPMCMYSVEKKDGFVTDWHKIHYASRAAGGAGLLIIEMTDIEPDGRITDNDLGLWNDQQIDGIAEIVELGHRYGAKVGIQIAHAGRKAEDAILPCAPSPIAFDANSKTPKELSIDEIKVLIEKFRQSVRRAVKAGVDVVELHGAHGYLIHQFHSAYTNHRKDIYGEDLSLFGRQVIAAVKPELPSQMPLIMRISAREYVENGYGLEESISLAKSYKEEGVDIFHVSSGGEGPIGGSGRPGTHAGYQIPYAKAMKEALGCPVIAVGKLEQPELANAVIGNEAADLVAVGRGMLRDPYWALNAAASLKQSTTVPIQYTRAFSRSIQN